MDISDPEVCPRCGGKLYQLLPGGTTPSEIRWFTKVAERYKYNPDAGKIDLVHPGVYCAGCPYSVFVETGRGWTHQASPLPHYEVTLTDLGPNRLNAISGLKAVMNLTVREVGKLIKPLPTVVATGEGWQVEPVIRVLTMRGATVSVPHVQ
jgi:hypothetical protein